MLPRRPPGLCLRPLPPRLFRCTLTLLGALFALTSSAPAHAQQLWSSWGYGQFGQLINGSNANSADPDWTPTNTGSSFIAVSCGGSFALGLSSNGAAFAWGDNSYGQLANTVNVGTTTPNSAPALISGLPPVTAVAANGGGTFAFGMALDTGGAVYAWGDNYFGQLGSSSNNYTDTPNPTPVQITGLQNIVTIAADKGGLQPFGVALDGSGNVWAWGSDYFGQLGNSNSIDSRNANATPAQVAGVSQVTAISAGTGFVLALTSSGTVYAWGDNTYGQLGHAQGASGDVDESGAWPYAFYYNTSPVEVSGLPKIAAIAAGSYFALALDVSGKVWAWGNDYFGQLGNSTNTGSTNAQSTPTEVTGLPAIAAIAAGDFHALAADTSGNVWAWGWNGSGQLGQETTFSGEITPFVTPVQVPDIGGCIQVAAGCNYSFALAGTGVGGASVPVPPPFRPIPGASYPGKRGASR
jgi:YD repeat-containing protein